MLRSAGGMFSNAARDERQTAVNERATPVLDHDAHQLKGTHNMDSSGYVSASSSRYATMEFIRRDLKNNGWVYLVRVRAGIAVNATWTLPPSPQECEVSVPGMIPWEDIVGWRQVTNGALQIKAGSLFPALYRLEADGLVSGAWGASQSGRRAKLYTLTKEGRKHLADEKKSWARAALAVKEWVQQQPDLHVRMAVATGEALVVLAARASQGEHLASGDVLNTAARLQAAAPVD